MTKPNVFDWMAYWMAQGFHMLMTGERWKGNIRDFMRNR
jgi:hypothetical protein